MPIVPSYVTVIAWIGVISLTVWAGKTPPVAVQPDWDSLGIARTEGRAYRAVAGRPALLDVYSPSAAVNASGPPLPRPALLAVHGGSWNGGSRAAFSRDPRNAVIRLAQQGMVVFAIDYRLARPGHPSWPSALDDLREAVRWVRRHSEEFGVDPGRMAIMGQASGGHLAALLGTLPDKPGPDGVSSRVDAVVNFYGPSDLPDLMRYRRLAHEPARVFLGDAAVGPMNQATEASPINHVTSDDPPMLLMHGTDDAWVPLDQSMRMAAALAKAGVPRRLVVVQGARHGFETLFETPARDLLPEVLAFLQSAWSRQAEAAAVCRRGRSFLTSK